MIQLQSGQLMVFQSALFQTNSTLVQTDDLALLADPNWLPEEIENIKTHLASMGRGAGDRPLYLLFTHSDYDHTTLFHHQSERLFFFNNPNKSDCLQYLCSSLL